MAVHLVCGYTRTGKDTLHEILSTGGRVRSSNDLYTLNSAGLYIRNPTIKWIIYALPGTPLPTYEEKLVKNSLAAPLKVASASEMPRIEWEITQLLKLDHHWLHYESVKDTLIVEGKLLRQHYIDYGAKRRAKDIDYWLKAANVKPGDYIADWRFMNELYFCRTRFPVLTTRLLRSETTHTDKSITSEHSLDQVQTDYLFVIAQSGEFVKASKAFPQYAGYQAIGVVSIN